MNISFSAKPIGENIFVEFKHNGQSHTFMLPISDRGNLIIELNKVIEILEGEDV